MQYVFLLAWPSFLFWDVRIRRQRSRKSMGPISIPIILSQIQWRMVWKENSQCLFFWFTNRTSPSIVVRHSSQSRWCCQLFSKWYCQYPFYASKYWHYRSKISHFGTFTSRQNRCSLWSRDSNFLSQLGLHDIQFSWASHHSLGIVELTLGQSWYGFERPHHVRCFGFLVLWHFSWINLDA